MTQKSLISFLHSLECFKDEPLVRVGRDRDGGYVLPSRHLEPNTQLITAGVSIDISFEIDLVRNYNFSPSNMLLIDPTIRLTLLHSFNIILKIFFAPSRSHLIYAIKLPIMHLLLSIYRISVAYKYLSNVDSQNSISLASAILWLKDDDTRRPKSSSIILKIDIEGSEYQLLDQIVAHAEYFSSILIELHNVGYNLDAITGFISNLKRHSLFLVHVHPNNGSGKHPILSIPNVLELTFSRQIHPAIPLFDYSKCVDIESLKLKLFRSTPNLDYPCAAGLPELY